MDLTIPKVAAVIALLISLSATYNAYMLRGGKLAWSEIMIVLGMISFMFSLIVTVYLPTLRFLSSTRLADLLFILGFVFLLVASLKLRSSLR